MIEAIFRRRWQKRFESEGRGLLWRIPDSPPAVGPEGLHGAGTRPCDLVGVLAGGRACAFEVKLQKGGRVFSVDQHFRGRLHQLAALREFARMGGYAAVVIGWIPAGKHRTEQFEVPIGAVHPKGRILLEVLFAARKAMGQQADGFQDSEIAVLEQSDPRT